MSLFVLEKEGVELPSTGGGIGLAVGGDVMSRLKVGFQLRLGFRGGQELELGGGVGEGSRVPLLAWRLVLLVAFFAYAVKLFAVTGVKIASVAAIRFAMDLIDG